MKYIGEDDKVFLFMVNDLNDVEHEDDILTRFGFDSDVWEVGFMEELDERDDAFRIAIYAIKKEQSSEKVA